MLLKKHLQQLEKYGQAAVKYLKNGKIRYYGKIIPAQKMGIMAGRRTVREWNPANGKKRTWHETLDYSGEVRQVRPQRSDRLKIHYQFNELGNYIGKW